MRAGCHALAQGGWFSLQIDWRMISIAPFARKVLSRPNFKVWTGKDPSGRETALLDGKVTPSGVWGAGSPPGTAGGLGGGSPPVKIIASESI